MASPYSGLTESELVGIRQNLVLILQGKRLAATSIQGASSTRRVDSLEAARIELRLVNIALHELDPTLYPGANVVTRTYLKAT